MCGEVLVNVLHGGKLINWERERGLAGETWMGSEGYGSSSLYGLGAGVVDMDGVRGYGIFVEMRE